MESKENDQQMHDLLLFGKLLNPYEPLSPIPSPERNIPSPDQPSEFPVNIPTDELLERIRSKTTIPSPPINIPLETLLDRKHSKTLVKPTVKATSELKRTPSLQRKLDVKRLGLEIDNKSTNENNMNSKLIRDNHYFPFRQENKNEMQRYRSRSKENKNEMPRYRSRSREKVKYPSEDYQKTSERHRREDRNYKREHRNNFTSTDETKSKPELQETKKSLHDIETCPSVYDELKEEYRLPETKERRVIFDHEKITAVLAIVGNSYTLTNGIRSICVDESKVWDIQLVRDIKDMKVGRLYVIGRESKKQFLAMHEKYPELKRIHPRVMGECIRDWGRCAFCKDDYCHRWMAIVGGYQTLTRLPIEPIVH